jgi:tetratricopeptide (TPR) repeat protein
MGFEPPRLPRSIRTRGTEGAPAAQTPTGPPSERMTLAAFQDRLERARLEYAARRYDSTIAILRELALAFAEVVKMPEPAPDRALLAASVLCLMARALRQSSPSASASLFRQSVTLFRAYENAIPQQKLSTRLYTDYGIALYRTGDTDQAIRVLEVACGTGATPPEAFGYLGLAYQSKEQWEAAETCLRKGLQLSVDDPVLTRHLAVVLEMDGKLAEAASAYADAALAHQQINQLDAAAELVESALRLAPLDPHALVLAVQIEHARQKPEKAAAIVEKVLSQDPSHQWARGLQAIMLRDRGQFEEALKELAGIDANTAELAWVLVERARTLVMMDGSRMDEALKLLGDAAALDPNQADTLLLRGEIEIEEGNYRAATTSLTRAVELDPQNALVLSELGRAHLAAGEVEQAHRDFDRALATNQTLVAALVGKANAYLAERKLDDALLMIRRAQQFEPDNVDLVLFLAAVFQQQNSPEGALAEVEGQLQRSPDDVRLLTAKGDLLVTLKRYGDAQKAFEAAAPLVSRDLQELKSKIAETSSHTAEDKDKISEPMRVAAEIQSKLAETARLAGDYEKAAEAYVRALELQPDSASAMASYSFYLGEIADFGQALRLSRAAIKEEQNQYWTWITHAWNLQHLAREYWGEAKESYERASTLTARDIEQFRRQYSEEPKEDYKRALAGLELRQLWIHKGLANTLFGLGNREQAQRLFEDIVKAMPYTQDPEVTALLGWCQYRLRRYDEALRLLQFSLSRQDPAPVQFDLALALLAASGSDSGYAAAIDSAARAPKLRQRGLFYIALFDLVEAIREEQVSSQQSDVTKTLSGKLAGSGVDVSKVRWLPAELVPAPFNSQP